MAGRQCSELYAPSTQECIGTDHKCVGPQLDQACEDRIQFAFGVGIQDMKLQTELVRRRLRVSR